MENNKQILVKLVIYFLAFLAFLPVIILGILQIPPLQTNISHRISKVLTSTFNTTTLVGKISYSLDNKLVIKDLYIEDYNLDTLFFIDRVKVKVWEVFRDQVNFSRLQIDGMKLRVSQDTNGYTNLLVFLDNLPTNPDKKQKSKKTVNLEINQIDIRNFDISYHSLLDTVIHGKFNPKNFHIHPLDLTIKNLIIKDSIYSFSLYDFAFRDKESGFTIKNMSTDFLFTNKQLRFKDFSLDLSQSHIYIPIFQVHYDSIQQLSDPQSLEFLLIVDTSTVVRSEDIKYFAPELGNNIFSFRIALTAFGSMGNINILPISLQFGEGTRFEASAHIIGLPDIQHTYIDANIDTVQFLLRDITSIKDARGKPIISLPKNLYKLSAFSAHGKLTGLINDFSAYVDFRSNLGAINTQFDVNTIENNHIKGFVKVDSLHLGEILGNNMLGKVTLVDTFNIYAKNKQFWGTSRASVYSIEFNDYQYHNIRSNITFDNTDLSAILEINDPNLSLSAKAIVNSNENKLYHSKFFINLNKINFYPLHLDKEDPNSSLQFALTGELSGHNINDFYGNVSFSKPLVYIKNLEKVEIKNFEFSSVLRNYINGLPFSEVFI